MSNIKVNCRKIEISNKNKICLISGPCQLESEQHALDMVGKIKEITSKFNLGFIYKTSFDKANRTSLKGKRGIGLDASLPIFDKIKKDLNVPILTDVHNIDQCSVVGLMSEWIKDGKLMKGTDKVLGGTMRLGSYQARLKKSSLIHSIYKSAKIFERHRHRYEVNINFKEKFEDRGMIFSGLSPDMRQILFLFEISIFPQLTLMLLIYDF